MITITLICLNHAISLSLSRASISFRLHAIVSFLVVTASSEHRPGRCVVHPGKCYIVSLCPIRSLWAAHPFYHHHSRGEVVSPMDVPSIVIILTMVASTLFRARCERTADDTHGNGHMAGSCQSPRGRERTLEDAAGRTVPWQCCAIARYGRL